MQRLTAFGEGVIEDSITLDVWGTRPTEHKPTLLLIAYHHRSRSSDSDTQEVTTTRNGLVQSATNTAGLISRYAYDALGRRTTVTDSRNNATTTAYNSMGQIGSVTDAAGKTVTYDYYPIASTMAGRLKSITNALSRTQYSSTMIAESKSGHGAKPPTLSSTSLTIMVAK